MIYLFKILFPQDENFECEIAVKGSQTLAEADKAIRREFGYDEKEPASFVLVNNDWEIKEEFPSVDFENPGDKSPMEKVTFDDVAAKETKNLMYIFDMYSQRFFIFRLEEVTKEEEKLSYPLVFNLKGAVPVQTEFGIEETAEENPEDDDDFGFDDEDMFGYDEDDLSGL